MRGLAAINGWLAAVADLPAGVADDQVVQDLLVSLGHIDSAVLAAISRATVIAEESGCAARDGQDGQVSSSAWVAQQLRLSGAAAARACRLAADPDGMPAVLAALTGHQTARS